MISFFFNLYKCYLNITLNLPNLRYIQWQKYYYGFKFVTYEYLLIPTFFFNFQVYFITILNKFKNLFETLFIANHLSG